MDSKSNLLLTFYGDDFTGSTDAMQAMSAAGLETVLFLAPPSPSDLASFPNARCVGLAGQSRGKSPAWMQSELKTAFESLAALKAPILQYKVCSTFDSAPHIGSIGQAIDIGMEVTQCSVSPLLIGAPQLGRYTAWGNLFAKFQDTTYRIDRHPSMSRHPVTPMNEGDLRVHLAKQTTRPIELIDLAQLAAKQGQTRLAAIQGTHTQGSDSPIVMIDVADTQTQVEAGKLLWELGIGTAASGQSLFSASSSGLQYALVAYWRSALEVPASFALPARNAVTQTAVVQTAVVSGSCSPMTALQIKHAQSVGYVTQRLNVPACLNPQTYDAEIARLGALALATIQGGKSPLIYSALGPDDAHVQSFDQDAVAAGLGKETAAERIGQALARVMQHILANTQLKRVVVAGGDSSGAVASQLGIKALTVAADLAPGVPLCRAWSDDPRIDGLEIALKGGQLGGENFYSAVLG